MSSLNETPAANRIRIAFFGLRNAGKSTLVNAFTGQPIAIVSDVAGTTTDPVSKAMEILPLGPCLITDTAGLDDVGELGAMRVEKTLKVLETCDIAVWVWDSPVPPCALAGGVVRRRFDEKCRERKVTVLEYHRGESVEALKRKIADLKLVDETPGLLDGLVTPSTHVICVCPIDESAPKGRLILPQVQVIRDCLDRHLACTVCQVGELEGVLRASCFVQRDVLVITDSQAFKEVSSIVCARSTMHKARISLSSFSILFARQKGDLEAYKAGLFALATLNDGDVVLIAEGCTHHRQCNDIGAVKIPKALKKLTGRELEVRFSSGTGFDVEGVKLIVHCGGCMLTRREVLRRIELARAAGIPIVNYGMLLAKAAGVELDKCVM